MFSIKKQDYVQLLADHYTIEGLQSTENGEWAVPKHDIKMLTGFVAREMEEMLPLIICAIIQQDCVYHIEVHGTYLNIIYKESYWKGKSNYDRKEN